MFIDLDGFKAVNDGMGHDAGDKLLVECAARLRRAVRPWDTVARFGGDEFTVLCEDVRDDAAAASIADEIRRALASPFRLPAGEVFVTASIGIARASGVLGRRVDDILESADRAMYQAKRQGGNKHVFFDHQLQTRMRRRLLVQTELHHAIKGRQFCLFYQPIVSVRSGELAGVEALLRWKHPLRGLIGPAEFIEEAESSGLIIEIGQLVLEDAARQAGEWLKRRPHGGAFAVSVNLSALQFGRHDLVDVVARTIEDAGTDPSVIHFEITESVLMDDIDATTAALKRLKMLGVGLVIDDFGTGYSSLSYLKRFPVDGLKIDQSFVKGLEFNREDAAIASTVIELAHTLELVAIAEGVETAGQLAQLKALGCDYVQGYFIGHPRLPDELSGFALQGAGR
jgi:diguanylate cyclase (GGDEF)-like protein